MPTLSECGDKLREQGFTVLKPRNIDYLFTEDEYAETMKTLTEQVIAHAAKHHIDYHDLAEAIMKDLAANY